MARKIIPCRYTVEVLTDIPETFEDTALQTWLIEQAGTYQLTTLLAHTDDGVIWGKVQDGKLVLSNSAFPEVSPKLRAKTLQQARLFSPNSELLLWRDGDGACRARVIRDEAGESDKQWCFDEPQIQWGDHKEDERNGFTLVADGQQGLRHAVPSCDIKDHFDKPEDKYPDRWHPLRLDVRHYLAREDDGALSIVQSRLTGLRSVSRKEVKNG